MIMSVPSMSNGRIGILYAVECNGTPTLGAYKYTPEAYMPMVTFPKGVEIHFSRGKNPILRSPSFVAAEYEMIVFSEQDAKTAETLVYGPPGEGLTLKDQGERKGFSGLKTRMPSLLISGSGGGGGSGFQGAALEYGC